MHFIDLQQQLKLIEYRVLTRIKTVLKHGAFIMGPEIAELESTLAEFVGVKHAVAVASGTDALLIALMALNISPGDEIITTSFSFFSTVEVITLLGAKPVFVDLDPLTYNINAANIAAAITAKTKAIIPVSLYGQCADFDEINTIANQYNLAVIEDAAQSFGATYKGRYSTNLSTIGCTSFFPTKPLGCYGDGGACLTNDSELALAMKEIRVHGQAKRYYHTRLGVNGRIDTIQAAILLEKLAILPAEIKLRQEVANRYQLLLPMSIKKPMIKTYNTSVYAQYTVEVDNRGLWQQELQKKGIPTAVHYPLGLYAQPIIRKIYPEIEITNFPHTERACSRVLSLPMHPYLTLIQQQQIAKAMQEVINWQTTITL